MAYLELVDYDTTYLAVCVAGLDSSYSRDDRYIEWEIDGRSSGSGSLSAGDTCSSAQYFISLSPSTTYYISATIYYSSTPTSGVDSSATVSGSFTTDSEPEPEPEPRPAYFSWDTSKTSGGNFNLTASEWNALMTNINSVRSWLGQTAYAWQSAQSGDIFTASDYNTAVRAIRSMSEFSGSLSTVSSGSKVYASQLNDLRDAINSVN